MAEDVKIAPDRVAVKPAEWDALVAFHQNTMSTMRALFADDTEGFQRSMRLLQDAPAEAAGDLRTVLDLTIAERDAARAAARRFEEGGKPYNAAMVRGLA